MNPNTRHWIFAAASAQLITWTPALAGCSPWQWQYWAVVVCMVVLWFGTIEFCYRQANAIIRGEDR